MKHALQISVIIMLIIVFSNCTKTSKDYSTTDHTTGMTKMHSWSGTADGYIPGDTVIAPKDTVLWALHFAHNYVDTFFAVQKINGFELSLMGAFVQYRSTDLTNQIIKFDSIAAGTVNVTLTYFILRDSMTLVVHNSSGFNAAANQYYQTNLFLHTN